MRGCTPAELAAFVEAYPRKLVRDVYGACEPPLVTFNDFTRGDWPASVVAQYHDGYPEGSPAPQNGAATGHMILDTK